MKVLILAGTGAALVAIGLWILPEDTANEILNAIKQEVGKTCEGFHVVEYHHETLKPEEKEEP